ncbi:MAG: DUF4143 domain-containing protein [Acidimicrobiaceae bacterium]|nr:DUF4143 domain-containing protein [Acidimicrobiaceae bacterium]MCY4293313.1 DUF4143 domain-containing protein [Acidimicrobiaceae bacterium]
MVAYIERMADARLAEILAASPAVIITGARGCGKTTTALRHAASVVRLDNPLETAAFEADPDAALRGRAEPLLLDEWQECPSVVGAVKRAVDTERRPGRFILTGSARFDADPGLWPGTGRLIRIAMQPMTVREQLGRPPAPFFSGLLASEQPGSAADGPDLRGYVEIALRGGFPEPTLQLESGDREAWLDSYVEQLLVHERARGRNGVDPARLAAFFEAYATNSAGLVHDSTLSQAAGIDLRTAQSYTRLLTDMGIAAESPAWSSNRLKRLARMSKRHVTDTGLWASAVGADADLVMGDGDLLGRLIDTFVTNQLRAESLVDPLRPRLCHLRDRNARREVDLVADLRARGLIGVEIKAHGAPRAAHAKHLMWLRDELGEKFLAGVVLHTGPGRFTLSDRIEAIPICALWT